MEDSFCSRKSIYIVTGASRGFGREISLVFSKTLSKQSVLILISRDHDRLMAVKEEITKHGILAVVYTIDFGNATIDYNKFIQKIFNDVSDKQDYEQLIVVHNAGTMCDVKLKVSEYINFENNRSYADINFSSIATLNACILSYFKETGFKHRYIINVSSLCAIQPIKSMGNYCAVKAARNMLFQVLAEEEPSVRVLNYAPGPMDTEMSKYLRESTSSPEIFKFFNELFLNGKLVNPADSAEKLFKVLREDKFKSGAHVDFYDV